PVGERAPATLAGPWTVAIDGCVERPLEFTLDDLRAMPRTEQIVDIHCVTRWTRLAVPFSGVALSALLASSRPKSTARFVSFVAHSTRQHSTSLGLDEALALETLVALEAEGAPLCELHGGPVRTIVPRRYFYKSLKWLARIELLESDVLGFWENTAGYHNRADPWLEQRYMAPRLSRAQMLAALAGRDFRGRDLRSIDARGHDLRGLRAAGALLRDADFRGCRLGGASFEGANLSNAHFEVSELTAASFVGADVEGASFVGADLRGADFSGASLFGCSFVAEPAATTPTTRAVPTADAAIIDYSTRIELAAIEQLTPLQAAFVAASCGIVLEPRT
ncbi:MAG TPA: molybdopterin-dependent oxidoreductase, partial [Pirellulales bacterium]|nr:molybdopterin-dependent oxidoreductase [Pirellulales bacterium]